MPGKTPAPVIAATVAYVRELIVRGLTKEDACRVAAAPIGVAWQTVQRWSRDLHPDEIAGDVVKKSTPDDISELIQEQLGVVELQYRQTAAQGALTTDQINRLAAVGVLAEKAKKLQGAGRAPRRSRPVERPPRDPDAEFDLT